MRLGDLQSSPNTARVLHVINTLDASGAEVSLHKLLAALDRSRFESAVVSLAGHGVVADKTGALDIPIYSLGLRERGASVRALQQLLHSVKSWRPDLVQGWMYYGNLAAVALAGPMRRRLPIVWNVRHSIDRLEEEKTLTRWSIQAGALLSRQAMRIIYNSQAGAQQHEQLGYSQCYTVVIPNGFDTRRFEPSAERRRQLRNQLGISQDTVVVGMVARYHPMKNHDGFLEAARHIHATHSHVVFVLAGRGVMPENLALKRKTKESGLEESVRLLGEIRDVPPLMAALDVLVSASAYGEGFPNTVGEAMAAGVPCVVTDVGDSAMVVGSHGSVVAPRDTSALATAVATLIDMGRDSRQKIGLEARDRIVNNFSSEDVTARYAALYEAVLG